MAALFVCTEQTLIDILLAFTDRNDMIKKDKKPWQMETAEWRFYGTGYDSGQTVVHHTQIYPAAVSRQYFPAVLQHGRYDHRRPLRRCERGF